MTLQQIGSKWKTDKSDAGHSFNGKSYLDWYAKYFDSARDKPITFLEIGIYNGQSLRTWEEYFSCAKIYGIDIEDKQKYDSTRIKTFKGDQVDTCFLDRVISEIGAPDVILDDGSHINDLTFKSFNHLFPKLKSGGIYIVEDMMPTYHPNLEADSVGWPGINSIKGNGHKVHNERIDMDKFILDKIHSLDHRQGEIEYIHCYAMTMVIGKV